MSLERRAVLRSQRRRRRALQVVALVAAHFIGGARSRTPPSSSKSRASSLELDKTSVGTERLFAEIAHWRTGDAPLKRLQRRAFLMTIASGSLHHPFDRLLRRLHLARTLPTRRRWRRCRGLDLERSSCRGGGWSGSRSSRGCAAPCSWRGRSRSIKAEEAKGRKPREKRSLSLIGSKVKGAQKMGGGGAGALLGAVRQMKAEQANSGPTRRRYSSDAEKTAAAQALKGSSAAVDLATARQSTEQKLKRPIDARADDASSRARACRAEGEAHRRRRGRAARASAPPESSRRRRRRGAADAAARVLNVRGSES